MPEDYYDQICFKTIISFPGIVLTPVATAVFSMLGPTLLQIHLALGLRSSSVRALCQDRLKVYESPEKLRN